MLPQDLKNLKAITSIASGVVNLTVSFVLAAVGMVALVLKAAVSTAIGGILTVALIVAAIVVIVLALGCGQTAEPGQTARATDTPSPVVAASTPTIAQGTPLPDASTPRSETVSASPDTKTPAAAPTATTAPETPMPDASTPRAETVSASPEPKVPATAPTATAAPQSSGGQPTPRPETATATPRPQRKTANPIATSTPPPTPVPTPEREYEIVTLLPPDAIPSISNPSFVSAEEAGDEYGPDELVLGVEIDGDARAYSVPLLSRHEIVNDVVGGKPIAVTW